MLKWPTADTSRPKVADGRHPPTNCAKAAAACARLTSPPGPRSAGRANVLKWATSGRRSKCAKVARSPYVKV